MQIDTTRILIRRRLSTILAADVAGYSRLMGANEERTLERLDEARAVMDAMIARHGGRIANTAGDSVIAEFPNPAEAVRCALAVQEELRDQHAAAPAGERLQFRIGINLGTIMANGRDVLGDNVNIAARIENIARPGGICISGAVYDRIKGELGAAFHCLGPQTLKNISRPVIVYEAAGVDATPPAVALPPSRRRRLPVVLLAAAVLAVAAAVVLVATGVIRIAPPHPAVNESAPPQPAAQESTPTPESLLPSPLPEPAAGPRPNAAGGAVPPAVASLPAPTQEATATGQSSTPQSVGASQTAMVPTTGGVVQSGNAGESDCGYMPPICSALDILNKETSPDAKPSVDEGGNLGTYHQGENLNVSVTPMRSGYLYVDLIDGQKNEVLHLLPNGARPDNRVKAGQRVALRASDKERKTYEVGPPLGLKMLIAVQTPVPLFAAPRKLREPVDGYLAELRQRLHVIATGGGQAQFEFKGVYYRHE